MTMPEPGLGFYAILFTDIVLSTDLRHRLGDGRADHLHREVDDLTRDVGFTPATSIEEGLGNFVAWYRSYYGV